MQKLRGGFLGGMRRQDQCRTAKKIGTEQALFGRQGAREVEASLELMEGWVMRNGRTEMVRGLLL